MKSTCPTQIPNSNYITLTHVAPAEGSFGFAEGRVGSAEGHVGSAEGCVVSTEGRVGSADGRVGSPEDKVWSAEGRVGSSEGCVWSTEGCVGSADGRVGCTRVFGYQHVGISNAKWSKPARGLNARGFGLRWKIGSTFFSFFLLTVRFTSNFVFSKAVLLHSPVAVYYHLLLRRETRILGVAPFSFESWFFFCIGDRNLIHPQPLRSCGPLQE